MVKARVGARLKVAVANKKGGDEQLVPQSELSNLTLNYKDFSKRLSQLIANIRAHYTALVTLSNTSIAVANDVAGLAQNAPFADIVGKPTNKKKNETGDDTVEGNNTTNADGAARSTFISIHQSFAVQAKRSRTNYGKMVLDYVVQWESAVTTRINADLKTEEQLRVELVHYQGKVDSLRQQVDSMVSKGKRPKDELNEKLSRNTEKLKESSEQYQDFVVNLCILMDEVVNRSWRDLQPVLLEMARHDIQLSVDQAKIMQQLKSIVTQVKTIGKENNIDSTGRLGELRDLAPKELSTSADIDKSPLPSSDRIHTEHERSTPSSSRDPETTRNAKSGGNPNPSSSKNDSTITDTKSANSQFYVACATGDEGYMLMTLNANPAVADQRDDEGMTPLGIAARCGHASCIQILLEKGADANNPDQKGCYPLHHASEMGFEECVQILLDHEALVDAVDGEGFTPLHLACEQGHAPVVKLLTKKKASVDVGNPELWRPIHLAAQNGHLDCLKRLIKKGAKVTKHDGDPWTALHLAAASGFEDCMKVLLEQGSRVDDTDRSGSTPLQKASEKGHLECASLLLKYKADPNKMDDEGYTPLIATALEGNLEIMKLLLLHEADVDKAHPDGWTPLHLAAEYGFPDCIELLLKHGANIDAKNEDGWTALHKAAEQGNFDSLDVLLSKGADLEAANNDGFRALHVASFNGHANCIELLLDQKAHINEQDGNGCTALYWAASEGHFECAEVLIERSADPSIADADGNTPAQAAGMNGHVDCEQLFR